MNNKRILTKLTCATILLLIVLATALGIGAYLRVRSRLADASPMNVVKNLSCVGNLAISRQLQATTEDMIIRDFAGKYYYSAVFEAGTLVLNPDKSFSLRWFMDIGSPTAYTGTVAYMEKEAVSNKDQPPGLPDKLVPVKWGQRRYLILPDELDYFCESINQGWEPRSEKWDIDYLRDGDWTVPATGRPILYKGVLEFSLVAQEVIGD